MRRRTFCRRALGGVTGAAIAAGGSAAMPSFGRVTTRGHFDTDWLGQTYLKPEYDKYEYETGGTIPGYHDERSPDEICLYVHGWRQSREDVNRRFPKVKAGLERAGLDAPAIVFDWNSGTIAEWWIAAEYARQNGHKLGQFLADYRARNPETTIRLLGYSQGAMVVAPAAQSLYDRGWDGTIDSMALIGGALGDQTIAVGGTYAPGTASVYGEVDNFYKPDDKVLSYLYKAAEFNGAIGSEGIEGRPYENYEEHAVGHVKDHVSYWKYETGCLQSVVDEWADGIDGGGGAETPAPSPFGFADVSEHHWAHTQIVALARQNVVAGFPDGTFRPEDAITRAQLAAILDQAYDLTSFEDYEARSFDDVEDHWAAGPIERAAAAGFFSGYPDGTFRPEASLSRQQLLVALQGAPDFSAEDPVDTSTYLDGFPDADEVADWAREGVARMAREGKLRNDEYLYHASDPGSLRPRAAATRAQVVNCCYNVLRRPGRPTVVGTSTHGTSRTFEGSLGPGERAVHRFRVEAVEDHLTGTLETTGDADLDLYAAVGEAVTRTDYDASSRSMGGEESLTLTAADLGSRSTVTFLVDAYSGSGEYTLTITES